MSTRPLKWPPCSNKDCQMQAVLGGYVWSGTDGDPAWSWHDEAEYMTCRFCKKALPGEGYFRGKG